MENKQITERVIARLWQGELILLFPDQPGDQDIETCMSYMDQDGFAAASLDGIYRQSTPYRDERKVSEAIARLQSITGGAYQLITDVPADSLHIRRAEHKRVRGVTL